MIFLCDYGLLFWAEQRVPSGIAAVMLATIPGVHGAVGDYFSADAEADAAACGALLIGIGGVAVLMSRSLNLGGAPIETKGALALLVRFGYVVDCVGVAENDAGSRVEGGQLGNADVHWWIDVDCALPAELENLRDFIRRRFRAACGGR